MQHARPTINLILEAVAAWDDAEATDAAALAEIEARYDAFISALQIEQETILRYFEMRFAERAEALRHFYGLMDSASESGDNEHLEVAVRGIIGIIKENPLMDYAEFRKALADPMQGIEL